MYVRPTDCYCKSHRVNWPLDLKARPCQLLSNSGFIQVFCLNVSDTQISLACHPQIPHSLTNLNGIE